MARRRWTKEEKLQIVLSGLKDGVSVADLCRRHGISQTLYYQWKKKFLEAGALALEGKAPTREEALKRENSELKEVIADLTIRNEALKKVLGGSG